MVAENAEISPVPEADIEPIDVLLFVQAYVVVPTVVLVNSIFGIKSPAHTVVDPIGFTCADGLTVIVKDLGLPVQGTKPFVKVGVTVMVATCGVPVEFKAVNEFIPSTPLSAKPILALSLVQS